MCLASCDPRSAFLACCLDGYGSRTHIILHLSRSSLFFFPPSLLLLSFPFLSQASRGHQTPNVQRVPGPQSTGTVSTATVEHQSARREPTVFFVCPVLRKYTYIHTILIHNHPSLRLLAFFIFCFPPLLLLPLTFDLWISPFFLITCLLPRSISPSIHSIHHSLINVTCCWVASHLI